MVNRHINKGNQPVNSVEIENTSFSNPPCYTATLLQNEDFSDFIVCNQEVNSSLDGFLTCYKTATKNARGSNSHINNGVERVATVATKISDTPEPALDFIEGQIAKARHTLQLCRDDLRAKRQSLQLCHDRFGILMLKLMQSLGRDMEGLHYKLDELNLAEGLTPARRGKVGQPRKGFQHSKDYLRAAMMLSIDDGRHERTGKHISSKAEAIRVCQQVERILIAEGAMDSEALFDKDAATLQRSIRDGLKHFHGQDQHWDRLKKS